MIRETILDWKPSDGTSRPADNSIMSALRIPIRILSLAVAILLSTGLGAQEGPPAKKKKAKEPAAAAAAAPAPARAAASDRLKALEERVDDLEKELARVRAKEKESRQKAVEANFSKGTFTLGGLRLRIGGDLKVDLIDPQNEKSPLFGSTESPDPHLEFNRLRIEPQIEFGKSETLGVVSARAQIDFEPTKGDTVLKRGTFDHKVEPAWWLASKEKVGLDDRFMRPGRLTENYPLAGTAFWRDQEVAFTWEGTLGNKRGSPAVKTGKKAKRAASATEGDEEDGSADAALPEPLLDSDVPMEGQAVPSRSSQTRSTHHAPLDFAGNPGALKLHFSIGDGFGYDNKSVGKDGAPFNDIIQDNRDFAAPLALREIGLGIGYERDFRELGEFEILGFYYNDELTDSDVTYLQTNLTDLGTGAGYGTSTSRTKDRMGINAGYHLESYHLYRALALDEAMFPKKGDGLYLFYQWIAGTDGAMDRTGWYFQASYRISNPRRWHYLTSIEPVVRYGELGVDLDHVSTIPMTWSRRQLLVGAILGIVKGVYLKTEYAFNDESTGGGKVSNDELLLQLYAEF